MEPLASPSNPPDNASLLRRAVLLWQQAPCVQQTPATDGHPVESALVEQLAAASPDCEPLLIELLEHESPVVVAYALLTLELRDSHALRQLPPAPARTPGRNHTRHRQRQNRHDLGGACPANPTARPTEASGRRRGLLSTRGVDHDDVHLVRARLAGWVGGHFDPRPLSRTRGCHVELLRVQPVRLDSPRIQRRHDQNLLVARLRGNRLSELPFKAALSADESLSARFGLSQHERTDEEALMRIREACGDEERLDQLIADYLRAVPGGHAPDRRQLIEAHPDLAEELSSFFAARDAFQRFVDHLRRHRDRQK